MICENCKQRPATVTITMTQDNEQIIKHYCEVCSGKNDFMANGQEPKSKSIEELFSSWFGIPTWSVGSPESKQSQEDELKCTSCGMTFKQFLHEGKFNCPTCYESFHEQLPSVFKRLHNGATEHTGKIPSGLKNGYQIKKEIENLRQQMKISVENEDFEEAATLRDQIRALEASLVQGGAEANGD